MAEFFSYLLITVCFIYWQSLWLRVYIHNLCIENNLCCHDAGWHCSEIHTNIAKPVPVNILCWYVYFYVVHAVSCGKILLKNHPDELKAKNTAAMDDLIKATRELLAGNIGNSVKILFQCQNLRQFYTYHAFPHLYPVYICTQRNLLLTVHQWGSQLNSPQSKY